MTRPRLLAYLQLALPFLVALCVAGWTVLRGEPLPDLQGLLPLFVLATGFTTLISVNLDRSWARMALTSMNLAALFFFYLTSAHPAKLLAWL